MFEIAGDDVKAPSFKLRFLRNNSFTSALSPESPSVAIATAPTITYACTLPHSRLERYGHLYNEEEAEGEGPESPVGPQRDLDDPELPGCSYKAVSTTQLLPPCYSHKAAAVALLCFKSLL